MTKIDSMSDLQRRIGEWCEGPFAQATWQGQCRRLQEEIHELYRAYADSPEMLPGHRPDLIVEEMADVVMILFHMAHRLNVDLYSACLNKWDQNQQREWRVDPQGDSVSHVRV